MARNRNKFSNPRRRPVLGRALALFVILCGVVVLLASLNDSGQHKGESPAVTRLRQTSGSVSTALATTRKILEQVKDARYALESTDYGTARQQLQQVTEDLAAVSERLQSVRNALDQLARSPEATQLPAEDPTAFAGPNER